MTEEKKPKLPKAPSHHVTVLEVMMSGPSALGDRTWTSEELQRRTGLTFPQVYNAVAKVRQIARAAEKDDEVIRLVSKGVYEYTGPLKRGRKKAVVAASPTEEVPFTEEATGDDSYKGTIPTPSDVIDSVNRPGTPLMEGLAAGFERVGEAINEIFEGPKADRTAAATVKQLKTNRVTRLRRMLNDLTQELGAFEREWTFLVEKGRRYDKLSMQFKGYSSDDPDV